jgi:hypothetical protein
MKTIELRRALRLVDAMIDGLFAVVQQAGQIEREEHADCTSREAARFAYETATRWCDGLLHVRDSLCSRPPR